MGAAKKRRKLWEVERPGHPLSVTIVRAVDEADALEQAAEYLNQQRTRSDIEIHKIVYAPDGDWTAKPLKLPVEYWVT